MHKQPASSRLGVRQTRLALFPSLIGAVAAGCLVSGLILLWLHATNDAAQAYRAPAALSLVALAIMQLRLAKTAWRCRHTPRTSAADRMRFYKWLFAACVLCYVAGLFLGPDPSVGYFFVAALATWYTVLLWLLVERPQALLPFGPRKANWLTRFGQLTFASLMATVGAEAVLRLYALAADDRLAATYVVSTLALPPGADFRGQLVNNQGYWDDEFKPQPRPGVFRIAVLGDEMTLSGSPRTNCLSRIERAVPGIEIYNFGLPAAGPREYAAQLMHEVARYQPDLVLTFFSVRDDLTQEVPLPGVFDWRNLRLYQWSARSSAARRESPLVPQPNRPVLPSREDYLAAALPQLTVCRTPIDADMSRRWREAIRYLDDISLFCKEQEMAAALVIVPSEFQLNRELCDTLRRRAGLQAEAIDLELPQRRLTVFAQERDMPLVDLLPSLSAATDTLYARNDGHWNDRGHELAAEVLGRWIQHRYGSQLGATTQASLP